MRGRRSEEEMRRRDEKKIQTSLLQPLFVKLALRRIEPGPLAVSRTQSLAMMHQIHSHHKASLVAKPIAHSAPQDLVTDLYHRTLHTSPGPNVKVMCIDACVQRG